MQALEFTYTKYVGYNVVMILSLHVVAMVLSVLLTVSLFGFAVAGRRTIRSVRVSNRIITGLGVLAGVVLLVQHPILSTCITLSAYVLAFMAAEWYISKRVTETAIVTE